MQTLEAILAAHPFFQGLDARYMELITRCAINVRFHAGRYLFHEGEQAAHFYLIREGRIALETVATPHQPVTIETIETGEVLGWSWLFPPYRWHFSARAVEPIRAIMLDGVCLREKGETDHDLGYELMKRVAHILIQRLQATRLQLLDIYNVNPGSGGGPSR
ncbi:MAG TPA: cyclic nucleotide-binding domain-containing protein [Ktedonosporobacter sp.]|jgi:CRP-like cAMP-binding protein|nr:cyclic nucleotide-binding domain-containing protein [Ktedonosporobacter sp.]